MKLERVQYRSIRPNKSLGVLSCVSPLAERCKYLNYRYLITIFHKHDHLLRERFETLNRLNSKRCVRGFVLSAQFTFQPSRFYVQYDLAALVSVPDVDELRRLRLHRLIRACTQVSLQENSQQLQVTMPRKTFFLQMGR
jgi:hypothetical protein